jgi:hypothetical protein
MRKLVLVLFAFLLAVPTAIAAKPPAYFVDESKLPFDEIPGISTQRLWGVHSKAGYRIEVPSNWNGSLSWAPATAALGSSSPWTTIRCGSSRRQRPCVAAPSHSKNPRLGAGAGTMRSRAFNTDRRPTHPITGASWAARDRDRIERAQPRTTARCRSAACWRLVVRLDLTLGQALSGV